MCSDRSVRQSGNDKLVPIQSLRILLIWSMEAAGSSEAAVLVLVYCSAVTKTAASLHQTIVLFQINTQITTQ